MPEYHKNVISVVSGISIDIVSKCQLWYTITITCSNELEFCGCRSVRNKGQVEDMAFGSF